MANCYRCKAEVVFDNEHIGRNGKKIPLDPDTYAPHDCPMREPSVVSKPQEEKDDHGNEELEGFDDLKIIKEMKERAANYVDHTTAAKLKLKTITDPTPEGMDLKYNKLASEHNVKFSQYRPLGSLYTIAVWYEETKQ